jgi:hypothetical protein
MTVSRREWLRTVLQGIGIGMVVGRGYRDRHRAGE